MRSRVCKDTKVCAAFMKRRCCIIYAAMYMTPKRRRLLIVLPGREYTAANMAERLPARRRGAGV
jgi:hypothetical protein